MMEAKRLIIRKKKRNNLMNVNNNNNNNNNNLNQQVKEKIDEKMSYCIKRKNKLLSAAKNSIERSSPSNYNDDFVEKKQKQEVEDDNKRTFPSTSCLCEFEITKEEEEESLLLESSNNLLGSQKSVAIINISKETNDSQLLLSSLKQNNNNKPNSFNNTKRLPTTPTISFSNSANKFSQLKLSPPENNDNIRNPFRIIKTQKFNNSKLLITNKCYYSLLVLLTIFCLSLTDLKQSIEDNNEQVVVTTTTTTTTKQQQQDYLTINSNKDIYYYYYYYSANKIVDLIANFLIPNNRNRRGSVIFAQAQYHPIWPSKSLQQEIFLLNLEDGYFGCQVNESQDFLQLFELSKLCDGQTQCYLGTDEMVQPLKCNSREKCGRSGGLENLLAAAASSSSSTNSQSTSLATQTQLSNMLSNNNLQQQQQQHKDLYQCVNGVCLDGLCYCNDGWGGKSCDIPDENECKFRPCDVFAHCTNTMGSYYCSCFPGYDGDGMHCQDINECEIPSLAALCSDNSECCNLPGHFVCKCKPGYQQAGQSQSLLTGAPSGNSTVSCTDIDECLDERACGRGANCENLPGSFRCSCPPGFTGDPTIECIDMDECRNNPCGVGAQCTNIPGGYKCSCAPGFEKNPSIPGNLFGTIQTTQNLINNNNQQQQELTTTNSTLIACLDINECSTNLNTVNNNNNNKAVCGIGAQCINTPGAYFCQCPPNYTGNPKVACLDIDECSTHSCGPNAICKNTPGSFKCECKQGYNGNAYSPEGCQDEDECSRKDACGLNAQCFNTLGSYQCSCLNGYNGDPYTKCLDIDECQHQQNSNSSAVNPCGPNAQCHNLDGGYRCSCPDKYLARGTPEMGCERAAVDIECVNDFDCTKNAQCINSTCQCKLGYQINGIECLDVDECLLSQQQHQQQQQLAPIKAFTRITTSSNVTTTTTICGNSQEAICKNLDGSYECLCSAGYEKIDPLSSISKCKDINECDSNLPPPCGQNSKCFNTEGSFKCACSDGFIPIDQDPINGCKSPCDGVNCGQHATCKPHGEEAACVCKPGFTFDPNNIKLGCVDINECDINYGPAGLCGQKAQCTNIPGSYRCNCPLGYQGDAYRYCEDINECDRKFGVFGQCGELAICNNTMGSYTCSCAQGYFGDPKIKCQDIDECNNNNNNNNNSITAKCGLNAICSNLPGKFSCQCPENYIGDPYVKCQLELPICKTNFDCKQNELCQNGHCQCPFSAATTTTTTTTSGDLQQAECKHPCDKVECGAHATCQLDSDNQALCVCDAGYMAPSDGRSGCIDVNECIQGLTLTGMTPIQNTKSTTASIALGLPTTTTNSPLNTNVAASNSTSSHPCGRNALCRNLPGSFDCVCPPGYSGDAYQACTLDVRNQQQQQQQVSTTMENKTNNGSSFGNYQQEPRTSTCQEQCLRGYICSDGQCVKPDSCRDNQDCRSTMACEHVNQLIGFQCVNVCDNNNQLNNLCGPEAKCIAQNHKAICTCNSNAGYSGDPYDLINGCQQIAINYNQTLKTNFNQQQQEQQQQQQQNTLTTKSDHVSTFVGSSTTSPGADSHRTTAGNQQQQQDNLYDYSPHQQQIINNNTIGSIKQQPIATYELPLQTTPLFPPSSPAPPLSIAGGQLPYGQTQSPFNLNHQQQQQQLNNLTNQQSTSTTTSNKSQQQQQQQQQQTGTSPSRKRPTTSAPSIIQQPTLISIINNNNNNNLAINRQENEIISNINNQRQDSFSLFNNKSALIANQNNNLIIYKQISCTSDQHCPGNLFCLSSASSTSNFDAGLKSQISQKFCGCPNGYKREADYCFMSRTNCTSSSLCRAREECISTLVLQQYYQQQQQLNVNVNQQFSLSAGDEFTGICICPRGYKLTASGIACIDRNECDEGTPCAVGAICQNKIGSYECVCPPGTIGEPYTKTCELINNNNNNNKQQLLQLECQSNSDCANDRECDLNTHKCISPCYVCGPRAICTATNHNAICLCPPRFTGNAIDLVYGCQEPTIQTTTPVAPLQTTTTNRPTNTRQEQTTTAIGVPVTTLLPTLSSTTLAPNQELITPTAAATTTTSPESVEFRTIPPSELFVMCLADGIQVEVQLGGFDGIIYVKGHSQDPKCRKLVMSSNVNEFVDFKVQFGNCDLIHRDGEAGFVLVIQKHPKLVTYRARAYHVKCVYNTGERTVTLGFNVSMITTSGTIANTGPPPTCLMSITALNGNEVTSAEIGQDLLLRVDVQPDSIYGGFARSCEAKTMDDEGEYQYEVTDSNGCATDPSIFSDWKYDQDRKSLIARFNAFKFPSSNNLRFQCNIRVCFGSCPAVNCNGIDAYGRKRRRRRSIGGGSNGNNNNNTNDMDGNIEDDELIISDAFKEGALREEIMVQSNAILTFDKKESASLPQTRPQVEDIEFVCLPRLGILMSILIIILIALLTLATIYYFINKRRKFKRANYNHQSIIGQNLNSNSNGFSRSILAPLPHPIDIPNPLLRSSSSSTLTNKEHY